jgi:hypothetical protein
MWATTTSGSLHSHNITDIRSADQAARTFPNAGETAKTIFALGNRDY